MSTAPGFRPLALQVMGTAFAYLEIDPESLADDSELLVTELIVPTFRWVQDIEALIDTTFFSGVA
jgi:hypothetical protein